MNNKKPLQRPIFQEEINESRTGMPYNFIEDGMFHETGFPLGASYPSRYMQYQPVGDFADKDKCLLGRDGCVPLCSGYSNNPCNVVAPVPGPQWQVQTAATVQNNLKNQKYIASVCPIGPTVLRDAPACMNGNTPGLPPQQVQCVTAKVPPKF